MLLYQNDDCQKLRGYTICFYTAVLKDESLSYGNLLLYE